MRLLCELSEDATTAANGTTLTATNSSFSVVTGSFITFDTSLAYLGYNAFKYTVSASIAWCSRTFSGARTQNYMRTWIYMTAYPAANTLISSAMSTGATTRAQMQISTTGNLIMKNGTTAVWTSTSVLPLNQWVRIEWLIGVSAGASQQARYYTSPDSTGTPTEDSGSQTYNSGTIDRIYFGSTTSATWTYWQMGMATSPSNWIGQTRRNQQVVVNGGGPYSRASNTSMAPPYPGGIRAGEDLIMVLSILEATANWTTPPAGWTVDTTLRATGNTAAPMIALAYKRGAAGTETGTLTATIPTGGAVGAEIFAVSGLDATNMFDVARTTYDSSATTTSSILPTQTIATIGAVGLECAAVNGATQTDTPPTGWSEVMPSPQGTIGIQAAIKQFVATGASGTATVTWSATGVNVGIFASLRPAADPPASDLRPMRGVHLLV